MSLRVIFNLVYDLKTDLYVANGHACESIPGAVDDIEVVIRKIHTIHGKCWHNLKDALDMIRKAGFGWQVKSSRPGDLVSV